jgi:hypothetical protein
MSTLRQKRVAVGIASSPEFSEPANHQHLSSDFVDRLRFGSTEVSERYLNVAKMADLFDALHHAALGTPFCSTPFHTPNGAVCATGVHKHEEYKCRHQVDQSAEQPLVLLDCITKPPATWRYDFVHTFVVAVRTTFRLTWAVD